MNTQSQKIRNDRGVSLVELLVVIVLIAILAAFAMMQRGSANEQLQRQNVARELKVALERARFDSVKRRAQHPGSATADTRARVVLTANSYTLVTDNNANADLVNDDGTFDSGDAVTITISPTIVIAGSGIALPVTVLFDHRGEVTTVSSSGIDPNFLICNVDCSSPTNSNSNLVLVTPTGTVNLLGGGSSVPTFSPPPITNVPVGTAISNTVVIP